MDYSDLNFALATPEIVLATLASVILLVDAFVDDPRRTLTHWLSLGTLVLLGVISAMQLSAGTAGITFHGLYVADTMSHVLKLVSYFAVGVTLIYSREYASQRQMLRGGEFYVLSLFCLLGQMVMISASNLLSIYLGLELMSLSLYAMVALRREHTISTEAAMKYFVLGALASGFMLYGMSMVYGATGALSLDAIAQAVAAGANDGFILTFGLVFLVAGLAFKLGSAPFHMWVPDVYQGAPTPVTLMLGAAPKLATFAITMRILVDGLFGLSADWQPMLAILAVASLAIGNLTAIMQTNFKRMLAYSTISHMGFVLLGLMSGVSGGDASGATAAYSASMFYAVTYVLSTLASFGIILLLSRSGFECEEIADLKGLARRSPLYGVIIALLMFSLMGIPPAVGFHAKWGILQALLGAGHVTLAVIAVLFSLIGGFYYLRVIKVVWFDKPDDAAPAIEASAGFRSVLTLNSALILVLGIVPAPLMALCTQAIAASFTF